MGPHGSRTETLPQDCSQRLVMTPSLQQAIKLLQMTARARGRRRAGDGRESGPRGGSGGGCGGGGDGRGRSRPATRHAMEERRDARGFLARRGRRQRAGGPPSATPSTSSLRRARTTWRPTTRAQYEDREAPPLENTLTREPDLYDHLPGRSTCPTPRRRARDRDDLVGNLDPDGFLRRLAGGDLRPRDTSTSADVEKVLAPRALPRPAGRLRVDLPECLCCSSTARERELASGKILAGPLAGVPAPPVPALSRSISASAVGAGGGHRGHQDPGDPAGTQVLQRPDALRRARRLRAQGRRRVRHPAERRRAAEAADLRAPTGGCCAAAGATGRRRPAVSDGEDALGRRG